MIFPAIPANPADPPIGKIVRLAGNVKSRVSAFVSGCVRLSIRLAGSVVGTAGSQFRL
ncbi:MAG: hypothetical protein F6K28_08180 [Microcoleus sp. SIO2G3]|nr:hypothetical protein [Microcoleus sp. SIO2G3]